MSKNVGKRKHASVTQNRPVKISDLQFKWLKQKIYEECINEVAEDAMAKVLLVSVCVIQNDFGKLMKKETRLKNFHELFKNYCEKIACPTPMMLQAEDEFKKQTNMEFIKDEQ